ncbi:threonine--tRNA ligase [Mycoplasma iguanae]|uniref:Threonine--tRNA ligase n=1 Tax=Mycoplasma iguanae TaxID=292461 RepID=A0ABY5RB35_9MOLU|nr:threonine--tRNA ligase [Mycoplasma iguanae]UVD81984.1 threonine--tRNA ligase [Mycoplasma iguanae]
MKLNKELNHTSSHLLAAAVLKHFPETKLGFGPATQEGFYYDFEFKEPISENDLQKIEKTLKKMAAGGYKMIEDKNAQYSFDQKPYKKELYDEIIASGQKATFYSLVNPADGSVLFTDLCAGGHLESTASIKHVKLLSLAGAYWRGNSNNIQLTRIYGTAWETQAELEEYLNILKERKERDHRKIGKELKIFSFNALSGQGMPIWLEDGMKIRNAIHKKVQKWDRKYGFNEVLTPHFGEKELYEISGHWQHYKDDMFSPIEVENELLVARPMTCPHHVLLYKAERRSYRELPIRYSELSRLYRYEKSGALTGLERVRSMDLTEGHIFARVDQIEKEFVHQYKLIKEVLDFFKIKVDYISFSKRDKSDKEKFFNDDQLWDKAEKALENVLKTLEIEYIEKEGEAAFYGPKIDIQVRTVLGHEITMSTLQLDFLLPQKFKMEYIDQNETKQIPVLIHRGLIGTYERFISILLEQTKGNLPFWMSPKQVVVIPVNYDLHHEYAQKVHDKLFELGFHSEVDFRNERINKKIREAQMKKIKFQVIIGDEELQNETLTYRKYGSNDSVNNISLAQFIDYLNNLKNEN